MTEQHDLANATLHNVPAVQTMHPLVQAALRGDGRPDTEMMRELMQLQRDWEAGEARKAFNRAMTALRADLPAYITHDQEVDYPGKGGRVRYTHASLAKICDEVAPIMTRHGFTHRWTGNNDEHRVTVTCELTHRDGHSISRTMNAPIDSSGGKSQIQGIASSETMLRRYTLTGLLGLATVEKEPVGDDRSRDRDEPEQKPAPDPAKAARVAPEPLRRSCLAAFMGEGDTQQQVEDLAGLPFDRWTSENIASLREIYKQRHQKKDATQASA